MAKADIQKAFDTIDFDAINKGLLQQGVAPKTRIIIMTKLMNEFMTISFAGTSTRPIQRNRACNHGGPDSMDNFIVGFDVAVMNIIKKWKTRCGFELDENTFISNIQQADDFYIIASPHSQLQSVINDFEQAIKEIGLIMSKKTIPMDYEHPECKEQQIIMHPRSWTIHGRTG